MYIPIGFSNYVDSSQVQAVRPYNSSKLLNEVRTRLSHFDPPKKVMIHDCSHNRPKNSIIICTDGVYYLSNKTVGYIVKQLNGAYSEDDKAKDK
jgi:hypothetical protein